jgi:hypothetical protein
VFGPDTQDELHGLGEFPAPAVGTADIIIEAALHWHPSEHPLTHLTRTHTHFPVVDH